MIKDGKLKNYFIYAIGEVFLIMIGILLALQINTIKEKRIKRSDELTIYTTVKDQITNYEHILENDLNFNKDFLLQFEYASKIIENKDQTQTDTLGKIAGKLINYSDFDGIGNIYETLVNSGEIKLLNNLKIVEELRRLEEQFMWINRMETIHYEAIIAYVFPSIIDNIKISTGEVQNLENLYNNKSQNLILMLIRIMSEKEEAYLATIRNIKNVINLIDEELNRK